MFNRIKSNPLWHIFFEKRLKNTLFSSLTLTLNLIGALLEGVSFSFIWISLSYLTGEQLNFLPSWLENYLTGLKQIQLFSVFMFGAVIAQIFRSVFIYLGRMVTIWITLNLQTWTQEEIYRKIFTLSFPCVNRYKLGDLVHYATAPPTYFHRVTEWTNQVIVSSMMIFIYVIFMLSVSIKLTCITLTVFGIVAYLQKLILKKIVKSSHDQSNLMVELNNETAQTLSGLRTVHIYNQQAQILKKIKETIKNIARASFRLNKWNQSVQPINETMGIVLVGFTMMFGLLLLQEMEGHLFSILITFLALTFRLGTRLQILMCGCGEIAVNMGGINRLKEILTDQDKEYLDSNEKYTANFEKEIQLKHVSLVYPNKTIYSVRDVSLIIPKGKVIAFVGPSGGGKTSLLDLILRLYEPTKGNIFSDGKPVTSFNLFSWRELFGVVSQDVFLFNEDIEMNILHGKYSASKEEVIEAAKLAGAHHFIEQLPEGYQTVVGEKGYKLSGGEKQRIALARALVRKPEILILDEATSNLDSQSEQVIQEALDILRGKTTIIVVAHRLATISMADQIFLLDKGQIIEKGTHSDLVKLKGRYHYFWSLQTSNENKRYSYELVS